jgi:hypothetical protein
MRLFAYIPLVAMLPVSVLTAQDIATPQKRMASLELAKTLLVTKSTIDTADQLNSKNPFNPKPPETDVSSSSPTATVVVVADRDRLAALAPLVTPSGSFQIGGKAILLFGQKKFKVGDTIPIVFQGVTYELLISSIDRITFTLRLNNEEITRPIKSVVK